MLDVDIDDVFFETLPENVHDGETSFRTLSLKLYLPLFLLLVDSNDEG